MKKKFALLGSVIFAFTSVPAFADDGKFAVDANVAEIQDVVGVELGVGYRLALGPIRLTPMIGIFLHEDEDSRYRSETFDNGNTVCRDTTNGQFADDNKCGPAADFYGKVEAAFDIMDTVEVGAGARITEDEVSPYGVVAYRFSPVWAIRASAGEDYLAGGVLLTF